MHKWFLSGLCAAALALPLLLDALSHTLLGSRDNDSEWVGKALRRKGEIALQTTAPQILLVGGSNVNFGYSADQVMRQLSVPATNLAVHAGLGRRYIFWDCLRYAKRGDLVVLALEYDLYGHPYHDPAERYQTFIYDRKYYEQLTWREKFYSLGGLSPSDWAVLWRSKVGWPKVETGRYTMVLNERGDYADNARRDVRLQRRPASEEHVDPQFAGELSAFVRAIRQRGANVVLAFPNLLDDEFRRRVKPAFVADLRRATDAAAVRVVGTPEDSAFPAPYVYDTIYHLNAAGTQIATRRLVGQLREAGIEIPMAMR